jgi:hypothetical protein
VIAIPIVFALLFALALFGPISNIGALPAVYEAYGIADAVPWPLLILAVVLPVALYVAGLLLGRNRPPFARALILTVALATSFALYFGLVSLVGAIQPPLTL